MAEERKYRIRVDGILVDVSKEVYRAYYSIERHTRTLDEKDIRNGKVLYSDLDTDELLGEDMIPDMTSERVEDSAIYSGYTIPPYYDSMIAKIIVHAKDRPSAIAKMRSALGEINIDGVTTNLDYQYEIINHSVFQSGNVNTHFIQDYFEQDQGEK